YISSNKPTYQLCHYYFKALEGHKPGVHSSHNNLHRNWRLPEYHDSKGLSIARDELLSKTAQRLKIVVVDTLKEKTTRRKIRN
ncbi:hypothetical protein FOC4_g10006410, partial [Fusarium odoratissimum]